MTSASIDLLQDMVVRHQAFSGHGRGEWARRVNFTSRLEAATSAVMAGCRAGIDRAPGLDSSTIAEAVNGCLTEIAEGPVLPLHALVLRFSQGFRAAVADGDRLPRKEKKAYKKALEAAVAEFADVLRSTERAHGYHQLSQPRR
ncbi:hypothetical protein [Nocardioides sp. LML1-1-1.1]|uniref:hypothetical protein n=1 Tax=Nocardioides sp. LML1-1-1.1 TaxID=3135248 RepID=UPI00342817DC